MALSLYYLLHLRAHSSSNYATHLQWSATPRRMQFWQPPQRRSVSHSSAMSRVQSLHAVSFNAAGGLVLYDDPRWDVCYRCIRCMLLARRSIQRSLSSRIVSAVPLFFRPLIPSLSVDAVRRRRCRRRV